MHQFNVKGVFNHPATFVGFVVGILLATGATFLAAKHYGFDPVPLIAGGLFACAFAAYKGFKAAPAVALAAALAAPALSLPVTAQAGEIIESKGDSIGKAALGLRPMLNGLQLKAWEAEVQAHGKAIVSFAEARSDEDGYVALGAVEYRDDHGNAVLAVFDLMDYGAPVYLDPADWAGAGTIPVWGYLTQGMVGESLVGGAAATGSVGGALAYGSATGLLIFAGGAGLVGIGSAGVETGGVLWEQNEYLTWASWFALYGDAMGGGAIDFWGNVIGDLLGDDPTGNILTGDDDDHGNEDEDEDEDDADDDDDPHNGGGDSGDDSTGGEDPGGNGNDNTTPYETPIPEEWLEDPREGTVTVTEGEIVPLGCEDMEPCPEGQIMGADCTCQEGTAPAPAPSDDEPAQ